MKLNSQFNLETSRRRMADNRWPERVLESTPPEMSDMTQLHIPAHARTTHLDLLLNRNFGSPTFPL